MWKGFSHLLRLRFLVYTWCLLDWSQATGCILLRITDECKDFEYKRTKLCKIASLRDIRNKIVYTSKTHRQFVIFDLKCTESLHPNYNLHFLKHFSIFYKFINAKNTYSSFVFYKLCMWTSSSVKNVTSVFSRVQIPRSGDALLLDSFCVLQPSFQVYMKTSV